MDASLTAHRPQPLDALRHHTVANMQTRTAINRRGLLLAGAGLTWATMARPSWADEAPQRATDFWQRPRSVRLRHSNGERLHTLYWSDGELIKSAHEEISHFMRDRTAGKGVFMDPVLFDILYGVTGWLDYYSVRTEVILTSGYRDPIRNAKIEGAARNSLHTSGRAADVSIPGVSTRQVSRFGEWLGGGGVGWYPQKGFIHLDGGRIRTWRG